MSALEQLEITKFMRTLNRHIASHIAKVPKVEYGIVAQVSPLLVTIDGSLTPTTAVKDALYAPTVGDRVYVHIVRNQVVVAGAIG